MSGRDASLLAARTAARRLLDRAGVERAEHINVEGMAWQCGIEIVDGGLEGAAARLIHDGKRGRIRLSTRVALEDVWRSVGNCGSPPRDKSRRFAVVAIALTVGAWIVLPAAVAIALAN